MFLNKEKLILREFEYQKSSFAKLSQTNDIRLRSFINRLISHLTREQRDQITFINQPNYMNFTSITITVSILQI